MKKNIDRNNRNNDKNEKKKSGVSYTLFLIILSFVAIASSITLYWVSFCSGSIKQTDNPSSIQFFIVNLFSLLVFCAIVFQAFVYWKQWKQTRELFEMTERPSLGIHNIDKIIYHPNTKIEVHAELKNSGKSPARNVYVISYLRVYEAKVLAEKGMECPIPDPLPVEGIVSRSVIPVNASRTLTPDIDHLPDRIEVERFKEGELILFLWVYATYESFGGREYFLKYYARFEDGGFAECAEHNDAD